MSRSRLVIVPLLLLVLAACGGKEDTGATTVGQGAATIAAATAPDDLASLVPANTDFLLYVPSLDDLQAKVRDIVGAFDEEAAQEADLGEMLPQVVGPLADLMDRSKPFAVAGVMKGEQPSPVAIVPVTDVKAATERFTQGGGNAPVTKGSYVVFAPDPTTGPGDGRNVPDIAKNLPDGDLAVRVNLASLKQTLQPQIDEILDGFDDLTGNMGRSGGPVDMSGFMGSVKQGFKDFVESAESLDVALSAEGTTVDVSVMFQAKAGSKLDGAKGPTGDLAAMAKALPPAAISVLLSLDFGEIMDGLQEFMDAAMEMYPENMREMFKGFWEKAKPLYDHLGNEHAMAMDISENGMMFVSISAAKDAKAYMEGSAALLTDELVAQMAELGMEYGKPTPSKVLGYDVHTYHMALDMKKLMEATGQAGAMPPEAEEAMDTMMEKMFGSDGIVVHIANVKGKLVMVMGGEPSLLESTMKAVASGGTANEELTAALDHMGGKASFLLHMDLRAILAGVFDLAKQIMPPEAQDDIPTLPDGGPVPITIGATMEGRTYVGRLSVDVKAIADMVKPLLD